MSLTYKDSGVDKEAGYKQVSLIKDMVKKTHVDGVMSSIGGFAGLFKLDVNKYKNPILVSGTDGVGTKLKLAFMMDKHNTIGEDCVAMCVNDILCQGAKPMFFLDYIGTGKLVPEKMAEIVEGVSQGCIKAGCGLIGGETAEMPGFYGEGEYDLAGFAVGVVDEDRLIDGSKTESGDLIFALASSGVHSNGFSLVRKVVFEKMNFQVDTYIDELGTTIGEELLKPTRIYMDPMLDIIDKFDVKAMSHITGGGFYENIPRVLNENIKALVYKDRIKRPEIFNQLMKWGNISEEEMFATFNMGVGLIFIVGQEDGEKIENYLKVAGEDYCLLGEIVDGNGEVEIC